jgi:ketosteroid isomerase-like protein
MNHARVFLATAGLMAATFLAFPARPVVAAEKTDADPAAQVRERERAFARTMADRDLKAFAGFLSGDAIFLSNGKALKGAPAIVDGWKRYYEGPRAPFSWAPETVEVVESGELALSTGPVHDPDGKRIGTFTSTWRREADGQWRIVLDSGCPPCAC